MTGENRKSAVKANAERMAAGMVFCLIIIFLLMRQLIGSSRQTVELFVYFSF